MTRPKKDGPPMRSISLRLTEEEYELLEGLADRYKWNLSQVVQTLIRKAHVEKWKLLSWEYETPSSGDS